MKAWVQRVSRAEVRVDHRVVGRIERGLLVLLGIRAGDQEEDARRLADRTVNLRVFGDAEGRMNLSVRDVNGSVLAVPQFTLYADTRRGNRPSFVRAAPPQEAERLYQTYVDGLRRELGDARVATGVFRASMDVELVNDGPVSVELTTDPAA